MHAVLQVVRQQLVPVAALAHPPGHQAVPLRDLPAQVHPAESPAAAHPHAHGRQAVQVPTSSLHKGLLAAQQPPVAFAVPPDGQALQVQLVLQVLPGRNGPPRTHSQAQGVEASQDAHLQLLRKVIHSRNLSGQTHAEAHGAAGEEVQGSGRCGCCCGCSRRCRSRFQLLEQIGWRQRTGTFRHESLEWSRAERRLRPQWPAAAAATTAAERTTTTTSQPITRWPTRTNSPAPDRRRRRRRQQRLRQFENVIFVRLCLHAHPEFRRNGTSRADGRPWSSSSGGGRGSCRRLSLLFLVRPSGSVHESVGATAFVFVVDAVIADGRRADGRRADDADGNEIGQRLQQPADLSAPDQELRPPSSSPPGGQFDVGRCLRLGRRLWFGQRQRPVAAAAAAGPSLLLFERPTKFFSRRRRRLPATTRQKPQAPHHHHLYYFHSFFSLPIFLLFLFLFLRWNTLHNNRIRRPTAIQIRHTKRDGGKRKRTRGRFDLVTRRGRFLYSRKKKNNFRTFFIFFLNIKTFQLGSDAEIRLLQDLERKSPAQPLAIWTNEWKRALKRTGRVPPPYYISEFNKRLFVYCGWGAFPVHVFVVQHKKTVHLVLGTTFFVLYQKFRNVLLKAQKLVCFFFFNLDSSSQITGFVKMSVRYVCRRFVE